MKKQIICILMIGIFLLVNCQKKNTTEPTANNTHPQTDIPWPSLADSPWPIPYGNAQCTARSNCLGPSIGEIDWIYSEEQMGRVYTSPVIGEDGTIYASDDRQLFAINQNGTLKWKFSKGNTNESCVLIGAGNIIYYITASQNRLPNFLTYIYALDSSANIIWEFRSEDMFYNYSAGLGLDGTLYFTDLGGYLIAVNNAGIQKWKTKGHNGYRATWALSFSFSPDGAVLYAVGLDTTINAIDVQSGSINRQIYTGFENKTPPLVDNDGNLYFLGKINDTLCVCSANAEGHLRWKFNHADIFSFEERCGMHMDYVGNIYFSDGEKIYSLDYDGNFRWKKSLPVGGSVSPIIGDIDNNIYIACSAEFVVSYNINGDMRFQTAIEGFGDLVNGALMNGNLYLGSSEKIISIK